jgi:enoyl-CoA hydratase/carnithine racemase
VDNDSTTGGVRVHRDGHVGELVLDRPGALNAVSSALAMRLAAACAELAAEPGLRSVVLCSSTRRAFCVGADLKERNAFTEADLRRQRPLIRAAFAGVRELPVPTVAAVTGYALGGGLELALSCDLIVADDTAMLGLPEVTVGLVPGGGGTALLSRRVGASRAADLILTGRRVDAEEADRIGLLDRRVPEGQALSAARELAGTIAGNSPVGVRNARRALALGAGVDLAAALEIEDAAWRVAAFSADRVEGVAAFNAKRRPVWPGEQ